MKARARSSVPSYMLFDTRFGACGIAWSDRGLVCLQLPERTREGTIARMIGQSGGAGQAGEPPPHVREAIERLTRHLEGRLDDLRTLRLDTDGTPPFYLRVYEATRRVGPGQTATYGQIAAETGSPAAARAVGQALGKNPWALIVPCHRVLAGGGKLCGFSAAGGLDLKARLLAMEGAPLGKPARG
jgi:methylated-DNA-[protein]-cysteine S-methyltransferase